MMYVSFNLYKNALRAHVYGKPFYASDLGLNGGEINGLRLNCFIEPTGNTKKVTIPMGYDRRGNTILREVTAKEWRPCEASSPLVRMCQSKEMREYAQIAREYLKLVERMGIEVE